jgi:uncharacterized protein (TIGR03067 family)
MKVWAHPVRAITALLLLTLPALSAILLAAGQKDDANGQQDVTVVERLQGDWVLAETVSAGGVVCKHREGQPDTNHFNIYIEKDRAIFHFDGTDPEDEVIRTFTVRPTKTPKEIDLVGVFSTISGDEKGKKELGIYKLDGDTLTLCLADEGLTTRPTGFKPGENTTLYRFTRSKKPISQDSSVAGYRPRW